MTGLVTAAVLATLVAFVISTAEAAFSRMSRTRAHDLLDEGRPGAKALVKVVGDTAAYLSVLSFLRVIAESTVAVMITLAVVDRVEGTWQPFLVAIAIMALISFAVVGATRDARRAAQRRGSRWRPHRRRSGCAACSARSPGCSSP